MKNLNYLIKIDFYLIFINCILIFFNLNFFKGFFEIEEYYFEIS